MLVYPTLESLRIGNNYLKMLELLNNHSVGMPMSGERAHQLKKRMLNKMPVIETARIKQH